MRSILSCQVKGDLVQHPYLTRLEEGKLQGHHIQIYYNETNFITNFSKEELNSEQVQISTSKYLDIIKVFQSKTKKERTLVDTKIKWTTSTLKPFGLFID